MRLRAVLLALLLLAPSGCGPTSRLKLNLTPIPVERRIGTKVFLHTEKEAAEGPLIRSGRAQAVLARILERYMPYYPLKSEIPVDISISPSPIPNAFSVPGHIVVNLGLIPCMKTEAQLAFVIGHELGHITGRHIGERYTQSVLLSIGEEFLKQKLGSLGSLAGTVGGSLYMATYSRSQEYEADMFGVRYMAEAGYDTQEAAYALSEIEACARKTLKEMGIEEKDQRGLGGLIERLLADHPETVKRIKEVQMESLNYRRSPNRGYDPESYRWLLGWASERKRLMVKIYGAIYAAKKEKDNAYRKLNEAKKALESSSFEKPIMANANLLLAEGYFLYGDYETAHELAKEAYSIKPDYYIAYKLAGAAALKMNSPKGYSLAAESFSMCFEGKLKDKSYCKAMGSCFDETCLLGAIKGFCLSKNERMCKRYCALEYRHYAKKGAILKLPAAFFKYCLRRR